MPGDISAPPPITVKRDWEVAVLRFTVLPASLPETSWICLPAKVLIPLVVSTSFNRVITAGMSGVPVAAAKAACRSAYPTPFRDATAVLPLPVAENSAAIIIFFWGMVKSPKVGEKETPSSSLSSRESPIRR
ncbi:hypothetical protein LQZ19_01290 [Treponema primitia]